MKATPFGQASRPREEPRAAPKVAAIVVGGPDGEATGTTPSLSGRAPQRWPPANRWTPRVGLIITARARRAYDAGHSGYKAGVVAVLINVT